eukprot:TRINITY_DN18074_c0_g1_i1.p4 TRINITY_DN18074_c0_g1~~TRINITY_DN18074_c0_g1_i1.p4  ORF type:complete len:121 (+),score=36.63 TRINITY_DN18074_c0_g1_i1:37-363(+)
MEGVAADVCRQLADETLGGVEYAHGRVAEWTDTIARLAAQRLSEAAVDSTARKFLVSVWIFAKPVGALHTSSACFWDSESDGSTTVRWENKSLLCVMLVFWVAKPTAP